MASSILMKPSLRCSFTRIGYISKRYRFKLEDSFKKTTADIINEDQSVLAIDSYNPMGFKLNNGINVFGPAIIFPKTVLHWNVATSADINEDSLSLFTILEPKLDILVIGKGDAKDEVNPMVRKYLTSKKIGYEILPTEHAISLLNFLISERRVVAGAFIPPTKRQATDIVEQDVCEFEERNLDDMTMKGPREIKNPQEIKDFFQKYYFAEPKDHGEKEEGHSADDNTRSEENHEESKDREKKT